MQEKTVVLSHQNIEIILDFQYSQFVETVVLDCQSRIQLQGYA